MRPPMRLEMGAFRINFVASVKVASMDSSPLQRIAVRLAGLNDAVVGPLAGLNPAATTATAAAG